MTVPTTANHARSGAVADEHGVIAYDDAFAAGTAWRAFLDANGIDARRTVALQVRTEARPAALLLSMLAAGQSVLIWRNPVATEGEHLVDPAIPAFSSVALTEAEGVAHDNAGAPSPAEYRIATRKPVSSSTLDAPYVYLPTSGTTGVPKIVAYEPAALWANARNCVERFQIGATDRVLILVALGHMYGLGAAFLPAVLAGADVRIVPNANLISYVRSEAAFAPTTTFLTPSFCHLLLKGRKQARPYRLTVLAGDAIDESAFAAYEARHGTTVNLYGSTELGAICAGSPDDSFAARRDTVGAPMSGVRIESPDTAQMAGDEPFPVRIDHPAGCAGYADDAGVPRKEPPLFADGWYQTMDLGRLRDDGCLQLSGRFDDTVKRDGVLVAFADVERALLRLGIESAIVTTGGSTSRGRELVAVCVAGSSTHDAGELRRAALAVLPGHAVPDRFVFVDALPLTATGKPDRAAIGALASKAPAL